MANFREVYCRRFACSSEQFERHIFNAVAYAPARLLAALGFYRSERFAADRAAIEYCGILQSAAHVAEELRDFAMLRENRRFTRRVLRLRISRRRLERLASECFGAAVATSDQQRHRESRMGGHGKRAA